MSEYGYTYPLSVRVDDLDGNNHVNNTVFLTYMQEARASYFRELWMNDWTESSVVVANLNIDFHEPILLDDEVFVDVRVSDLGSSSWTVEYRVRAVDESGSERVAATGSSVQVAWDRDTASSQELPDPWREKLEGELVPAEA